MAGFATTALTALPSVVSGVQAVSAQREGRRERALGEQQLAQRQAQEENQALAAAAQEREQLALSTQAAEEERRAALKRAVARQRASFGAQGVGSSGGSGQAVLLGLFEESEAERERRNQMDQFRLRVIEDDVGQRRASNILQRTQQQERNRLDNLTAQRSLGFDFTRKASASLD